MKKNEMRENIARINEIKARFGEMADTLANDNARENYTDAELEEQKKLQRELSILQGKVIASQHISVEEREEKKSDSQNFREISQDALRTRQSREITLADFGSESSPNPANISVAANAVQKEIKGILPNLEKGLIWNRLGMNVQTGVTSDMVWPYASNNIEAVERTEKSAVTASDIDFSYYHPTAYDSSLIVKVTNEAIDSAAFDLYGYVQSQLSLGVQRYLNKKSFGTVTFTGLAGPFAGNKITNLALSYENIKKKEAAIAAEGVDMSGFAYVCNAYTKAVLECTPKASGQGGFICENGMIGGRPVFVTEYACIKSDGTFDTEALYLEMGCFNYLAALQHGQVRLTIDPVTLADQNITRFIINTKWSLTDLSGGKAFKCFKLTQS